MPQDEDENTEVFIIKKDSMEDSAKYTDIELPWNYTSTDDGIFIDKVEEKTSSEVIEKILSEAPPPPLCDLDFAEKYVKWLKQLKNLI